MPITRSRQAVLRRVQKQFPYDGLPVRRKPATDWKSIVQIGMLFLYASLGSRSARGALKPFVVAAFGNARRQPRVIVGSPLKISYWEGEAVAEPLDTKDFLVTRGSVGASPSLFQPAIRRIVLILAVVSLPGCGQPAAQNESIVLTEGKSPVELAERRYLGDSSTNENADSASVKGTPWWRDETSQSGVDFTYHNGREGAQFTILESIGGGVALFDFDQDGDQDLLFAGGGAIRSTAPISVTGLPCALFLNDGSGHFSDASKLVEGPDHPPYSHGVFVSDFNRDGFPDALITGFGGCVLLRNEEGKRLIDVTAASGISIADWTTAAAWADVNRDGWPDLFVISYVEWTPHADATCGDAQRRIRDVCPPQKYPAARQTLFLNNQDGSFSSAEFAPKGGGRGKGLGCVALDLNGDGWIDFYVANDQVENQLYLGGPSLPMTEAGVLSATSGSELGVPEGSMGVDASDYDGDGRPDLFITNYELEDNSLYHNEGNGLFRHVTIAAGLGGVGRPLVGFGTGFGDFDLDGWLDLFVINGHVLYETGRSAYQQSPFLLHNEASGTRRRFRDVSMEHGGPWFQGRHAGRGAAIGDLDNDGDLDLVIVQQNQPATVLMNQIQPPDWLRLELRGTTSDPAAVGAIVKYPFKGREIVRHIRSGAGYLSHFDQRVLLPADMSMAREVTVQWLTGKSERFRNLQPRSTNLIREGQGEPL